MDFLQSLKTDLFDRRLLPLLGLVAVAFVAALAYAVLGGGSSTSSTPSNERGYFKRFHPAWGHRRQSSARQPQRGGRRDDQRRIPSARGQVS